MLTAQTRLKIAVALITVCEACSDESSRTGQRSPSQPRALVDATAARAGQSSNAGAGSVLGGGTWGGSSGIAASSGNGRTDSGTSGAGADAGNTRAATSGAGADTGNTRAATSGNANSSAGASGQGATLSVAGTLSGFAGASTLTDTQMAALLGRLQGNLELVFADEDVPIVKGCTAAWAGTRGYISIESPYCPKGSQWCNGATFTSQEFFPASNKLTASVIDDKSIVLQGFTSRRWASGDNYELVDRLTLDYDAQGLTGTGVAALRRQCVGQADLIYQLPVSLGPDRHRPVVKFVPVARFSPYAVSWGELRIDSSEQLFVGGQVASYDSLVGTVNDDNPAQVAATEPRPSMWPAIGFAHPADVAGTRQKLFLRTAAVDAFGNAAIADQTPFGVVDDSLLTDVFDFDVMQPKGLVGGARYVAPGSVDAPCESGGCVVLGPIAPCAVQRPRSFFSFRIATNDHVSIKIRSTIYSDAQSIGSAHAVVIDSLQYIWTMVDWGVQFSVNTRPEVPFGYTSGALDSTIVTQSNAAVGGALAFDCDGLSAETQLLWVVERLELAHDGAM